MIPDAVRALFSPEPGSIYLDTGSYGLPPRPTVEALRRAVDLWQSGAADWTESWEQSGQACRRSFAELIQAAPESVGLVPSVSIAAGVVAASLKPGDDVVVPDDEFTSVLYPLLVAQQHRGVRVRCVPFGQLEDSVRPDTRLVAFSLVQSQSGRTADLARVCAAARSVGAETLVDATHALPFVPVGHVLPHVDYLACAGYKHLLCPRGVSFFYVAPRHWERLPSVVAGWRSGNGPDGSLYGGPLDLAPNAARFDVSLPWFSWVGSAESLRLILDWRREGFLPDVLDFTRLIAGSLGLPETGSTVIGVPVSDAEGAHAALARAGIRASVRAGGVRFAPHVHNTGAEIVRAADAIRPFVVPAR